MTVLPPSVLSGVGLTEWEGQEMITETKTKGKPGLVRETLRRLHRRLLLLPTVTTKAVINERVRAKIAADILVMMKERGWREAFTVWAGTWIVAFLVGGLLSQALL